MHQRDHYHPEERTPHVPCYCRFVDINFRFWLRKRHSLQSVPLLWRRAYPLAQQNFCGLFLLLFPWNPQLAAFFLAT